ncbi:hypothetical protein QJS10_CPB12g00872 [Acorus calamus]|uniref:DNA-directed RNA polymerase III subunit RPC3 n=1 Tax=Acorus calamus TaxID=4465 RepID=A0AAV9DM71_ACOCL|nr:hypothetical protein QJS10_CPB12g00872 [Acorus calamus]
MGKQQSLPSRPAPGFYEASHTTTNCILPRNIIVKIKELNNVNLRDENASMDSARKHEKLEIDDETQATISENEVVWRPNYEKFIGNLRNQAKIRDGEESATALADGGSDFTLSIDTIVPEVSKKPGGSLLTMDRVRAGLDLLGSKSLTGGKDGLYKIALWYLLHSLQMESVVLGKFGNEAYRIFRHLADKDRPIEADQVSEFTLVERKVAHGILYKLWKDDYLHMQVVTHGPSNGYKIFLWKVNKDSIVENVLNDIYHAALNLNQQITEFKDIYSDVLRSKKSEEDA